jgi:hypothetical protein
VAGLVLALVVGYALLNGVVDDLYRNVATDLGDVSEGGGGTDPIDLPPAGTIWFGRSFDTETFAISGRTDTVSATETFALVASLGRVVDGEDLNFRTSVDGQTVSNQAANASGSGDVWGFTYGPVFQPGVWTIELTDFGGNVLASGRVTVTE